MAFFATSDSFKAYKHDMKGFRASFQQGLDRAEPLFITRAQPASPSNGYTPSPFTLQELLARELPPVRWAIPDILPEGLTLLAGKPKLGKSWLALSVALAVAAGGVALGKQPVTQGEVLYLALEDNERRLQSRAKQLLASMTSVPHGMTFALSWPRLDQGGLDHLEAYLQAHPHLRLVVVDTWAKIAPQFNGCRRSQYEGDYEALSALKSLADTYRVAIVAVHHLRKMRGDDVLDEITGSIGMTGAMDGALVLKRERGQGEATLFVTGRDIEQEQQLALTFDSITATWTLVGNAEEFKRTKERQEVIDLLTEHLSEGMSPRQVAETLDKNYHTTRSLLRKMEDAGEVRHTNHLYFATLDDISRNQLKMEHAPQPGQQRVAGGERRKIDYTDYSDYADDHPSPGVSDRHLPTPPQGDVSLQDDSARAGALKEREDVQQQDKHQGVAVISVINRNQCNQFASSVQQTDTLDQMEEHAPSSIDDTDYSVDAEDTASSVMSNIHELPSPLVDVSLQDASRPADVLTETKDVQPHEYHLDVAVSKCNQRNHCNQSEASPLLEMLQCEDTKGDMVPHVTDELLNTQQACAPAVQKNRCPHHPHTRWVRFDPSGQAWCDRMDCWDCYRLMKIGDALGYQRLLSQTGTIATIGQGRDAWASFVLSQGSFTVITAIEQAETLCKGLGMEVPDLTGEVRCLVPAW
jgi:AAA domain